MDVTNTVFDINDTVKSQKGSLIEIVPNYVKIIERIRTELYFKVYNLISKTKHILFFFSLSKRNLAK